MLSFRKIVLSSGSCVVFERRLGDDYFKRWYNNNNNNIRVCVLISEFAAQLREEPAERAASDRDRVGRHGEAARERLETKTKRGSVRAELVRGTKREREISSKSKRFTNRTKNTPQTSSHHPSRAR